jgi:hypothetical protein
MLKGKLKDQKTLLLKVLIRTGGGGSIRRSASWFRSVLRQDPLWIVSNPLTITQISCAKKYNQTMLATTSVADPHRKNADADPGKNLNADADPDPDADPDSCPY